MLFGLILILPLMLIIILGNLLYRYNFLSESDIQALIRLLYWVVLPALLFRTSYISGREFFSQKNLFFAAALAYLSTAATAWCASYAFFHKGSKGKAASSIMTSIRTNNLYVGFPIVGMALGEKGLEQAAVYFAVTILAFHMISIAGAEMAMRGRISRGDLKKIVKNLILNPLIIASALGISFSILGIKLWEPIDSSLKMLGSAATAVALIALGGSLNLSSLKNSLRLFAETWGDNLLRFAVAPGLMLFFVRLFKVPDKLAVVTVLLSSMPAAVNCFILAKGMRMDEKYTAQVVASTTIFSVIAIPVWVMLLKIGVK